MPSEDRPNDDSNDTANDEASSTKAADERPGSSAGSSAKDGGAIRADLNQLWKSTVSQFDEMKDILVRSGSAGKAKLEVTMLKRQQDKLFAELGGLLYRAREDAEDVAAFDKTLPEGISFAAVFEKLDALHADIREQQTAFDRLTHVDDAPTVKDADEGPPPEVVDAKDAPST